jgi:drug/metabolite transporter (DMT)-like permease
VSAPSRAQIVAAFAAIYLLWGGTFLAIRYAVADMPPLLTIALRCLGAAALLFGWLWVHRQGRIPSAAQWRTALVAGTFLFLGCHGILAWAEQRVSSGEAALFMTAIPLWLVLLDALRLRRLPSGKVLAGLGLGVVGVATLTVSGDAWSGTAAARIWLVVSALFWAIGSLVARHGARSASVVESTAMQLAAGGAVVLLASAGAGELAAWSVAQVTPRGALALGFLIVGGTVLGFGAYTWLLQVTTPAAVGSYAFVNPVIALGLAWLVGDGELTGSVLLSAAIVVGAVVLTWAPVQATTFRARRGTTIATTPEAARNPCAAVSHRSPAGAAFPPAPESRAHAAAPPGGGRAQPGRPGLRNRSARSAHGSARRPPRPDSALPKPRNRSRP